MEVVPSGGCFSVVPPAAAPGAYTLGLAFRDPGTGLTTRSATSIVLER
jgi:hypothetical protein